MLNNQSRMKRQQTGIYETASIGEGQVGAFIPNPLPPEDVLDMKYLQHSLDSAIFALGQLHSIATILPEPWLYIYAYIRREAVLSSRIEGMQSTLSDLMLFELTQVPGVRVDDVVEVSNYVSALEHGLRRIREDYFPLCNRLIREIHKKLLSSDRGSKKLPGEFRRSQNWLGGTRPGNARFVPPPTNFVEKCMSDLERFMYSDDRGHSALIRTGLSHVQFETIHPFLDGNGRVGRLLISLQLCHEGLLNEPLLYLSLHFKKNRSDYYLLLDAVRHHGDWEAWLRFFLEGITETSENAISVTKRLNALFRDDSLRIHNFARFKSSALLVQQTLQKRPISTLKSIAAETGLSIPAVTNGMFALEQAGIAREITNKKRNRIYSYDQYFSILNEDIDD